MSSPASSGQPRRDLSIDHLRALVVLALILFHTARLFDAEEWHVKNLGTFPAADFVVAVFNIVGMPLLFLLAGMSAYASLDTRTPLRFLGERFSRLFVPLGFGILLVVPPQVYVERISSLNPLRMSPVDFSGSFLDFYPTFFSSCCYPDGNFSWHHLWFLAYLFVFSVLLLPALLLLRRTMQQRVVAMSTGVASLVLAALGLPLLAIELGLRPAFPSTHALTDDWANNAHFMWLMLAGAFVMASGCLAPAAAERRRGWLACAALLSAGWLAMRFGLWPTSVPPEARLLLRTAAGWTSLIALIGYGRVHLARPLPFLTGFGAISMPFYIVHQTIIVVLGLWMIGWVDAPLVKYAVVALLSFGASLALAAIAPRSAVLRLVFGIKAPPPSQAPAPAGSAGSSPASAS